MFFNKKTILDDISIGAEEYDEAAMYAGGVGGYGHEMPKDKGNLKSGWWCPNCEAIYSPSVKECKPCNKKARKAK